ncbi:hypothetical protein DPMN_148269 [Dreissena polymorpha]|uniref:Uncharacterized protein n=1 Tax=Dreissena polymorpha TaxID=45954 RepID=A0A9D4FBE9_DREPO|nr:hypothetical protein DPMN_148269 [Dreissena polymorpha]
MDTNDEVITTAGHMDPVDVTAANSREVSIVRNPTGNSKQESSRYGFTAADHRSSASGYIVTAADRRDRASGYDVTPEDCRNDACGYRGSTGAGRRRPVTESPQVALGGLENEERLCLALNVGMMDLEDLSGVALKGATLKFSPLGAIPAVEIKYISRLISGPEVFI